MDEGHQGGENCVKLILWKLWWFDCGTTFLSSLSLHAFPLTMARSPQIIGTFINILVTRQLNKIINIFFYLFISILKTVFFHMYLFQDFVVYVHFAYFLNLYSYISKHNDLVSSKSWVANLWFSVCPDLVKTCSSIWM